MKHSIKEDATYNREVPLPVKYDKTHEDRNCLLITNDE
jgi:hypothetical protein